MRQVLVLLTIVMSAAVLLEAQARRTPASTSGTQAAEVACPAVLGEGVETGRTFCDVLTGRDPAEGIIVRIPPRTGPARLTFDLHNRQTYSEQQVQAGEAFARYTATIGVLTMNNDLIGRAVVQSEFRNASDLFDWIAGGDGPGGVKAIAPTGAEPIAITILAGVNEVSILGEQLEVVRLDQSEWFASPGRPIAVVSNIEVETRPTPARR